MRLPWSRGGKEKDVFENEDAELDPGFDLSDGDANGVDAGEAAADDEPSLDDFEDEETRGRVERLMAHDREKHRATLREVGLDLNSEGRPLIADAGKVGAWAGAVAAPRPQPAAQPVAQPPAAGASPNADEEEEEIDLLSATPQDLMRFVDRRVAKQTKNLADELAYERSLTRQRAASDSMQSIRSIVEERLPALAPLLDHPDFAAQYEQQIAGADPAFLANPAMVTGLAAAICANLDKERMPMPRDPQGRFTTPSQQQQQPGQTEAQARYAAQRQGLQGTPPARGSGVQHGAGQPDRGMDEGISYLRDIAAHLPPNVTHRPAPTAAEWDAAQYKDIEQWKAAIERSKVAAGNGTRRR